MIIELCEDMSTLMIQQDPLLQTYKWGDFCFIAVCCSVFPPVKNKPYLRQKITLQAYPQLFLRVIHSQPKISDALASKLAESRVTLVTGWM